MASDSPMTFGVSSVEFEDMEMTELDADTLMKLLEEEPPAGGEVLQEGGGGCVIQPPPPCWTTEESDGGGGHKKEEVVSNGFEWVLDVTTTGMSPAPPCAEEVGGEMLDMGEYGLDYNYYYYYQWYNNNNNNYNNNGAVLVEEMAFEEYLWQNSY